MKGESTGTDNQSPVVLITGASSGLGLAISRRLMQEPYRLILTARSESMGRFQEQEIFESNTLRLRPLNVVHEADRRQVFAEAEAQWGGVDILINNAGITYRSVVEHVLETERRAQMDINFRAPMEMIRLALPHMRRQRRGRILNISSVGGMMAMPTMALYSASKFALEGMTESLWYEVRPWNIKVSLIEPGFIRSRSFENTRYTELSRLAYRDVENDYHEHYRHMAHFIARCMRMSSASPEDVAEKISKVLKMENPPLRVLATRDALLFSWLRRCLPRKLYHELLYLGLPEVRSWAGEGAKKKGG